MADELEVIPSAQSTEGIEPAKTVQQTGERIHISIRQIM